MGTGIKLDVIDDKVGREAEAASPTAPRLDRGNLVQPSDGGHAIVLSGAKFHARHRLVEMQRPPGVMAIPVPDSKCRITRGLDLSHQYARAQGVADSTGEPDAVAAANRNTDEMLKDRAR